MLAVCIIQVQWIVLKDAHAEIENVRAALEALEEAECQRVISKRAKLERQRRAHGSAGGGIP
jgi:hypothetical protein